VTTRFQEGRRTRLSSPKSGNGGGGWVEIWRQRWPSTIELGQDAMGEAEEPCTQPLRGRDGTEEKKQRGGGLGRRPSDRRGEEKEGGSVSHGATCREEDGGPGTTHTRAGGGGDTGPGTTAPGGARVR
jgi:hypothetical protein